jgi:hypothetical protein
VAVPNIKASPPPPPPESLFTITLPFYASLSVLLTVALNKQTFTSKNKTKTMRPKCVQISSRGLVLKTISIVQCANSRYTFHEAVIRRPPPLPPKTKHGHNSPVRSSSARTTNVNKYRTVVTTIEAEQLHILCPKPGG